MLAVALFIISKLHIFSVSLAFENLNRILFPPEQRVYDEVHLLSPYDYRMFGETLKWMYVESGVDIKAVIVKSTGDSTIEELAAKKVRELNIGGKDSSARGVLILYDATSKDFRIEVGYGLENYFPDAFVGYLTNEHMRAHFRAGAVKTGFVFLLRVMHHRLREAVLGERFDPGLVEDIRQRRNLSGGAGSTVRAPLGRNSEEFVIKTLSGEAFKGYFSAQPTPEDTFQRYLDWLAQDVLDPKVELFTRKSQANMSGFPMSRAYQDFMLRREFSGKYKIDTRGDVAVLYFTKNPLLTPHFFRKGKNGWQMDLEGELRHSRNRVGGVYAWDYTISDDYYDEVFLDLLVNIAGYVRFVDGDNRQLPIHGK